MLRPTLTALAAAVALAACLPVHAASGDWFVRVGVHNVDPDSDNGTLVDGAFDTSIDSQVSPTFVLGRFLSDHIAVELLAALPFEHDVSLNGARAATFKHLPPTLTFDYYFAPDATVSPFLGLGINYTWTYDEETTGPLDGADVSIGNSFGPAAHAGLAFRLDDRWDIVADLRWIDIDADVRVDGADVGAASVDPLVYGAYVSYRF